MEYEELANMAQEVSKNSAKMGQMVTGGKLGKDEKEYLSAISNWDKDSGKFFVEIFDKDTGKNKQVNFDELYKLDNQVVKDMMEAKETLKDRAKEAQTFDETWMNTLNTFKATLLPAFDGFSKSMEVLANQISESGVFEKIGEWSVSLGNVLAENPKKVAAAIAAGFIVKETWWIARGMMLGKGFNISANAGGGMGDSSPIDGGRFTKGSPKNMKMMKGMKIGGAAALAGMGVQMATDSGMFGEEGSTGNKMGNVASSALEWGGTGAMIGSMIAPGIGTAIGGVIGGLGGALHSAFEQGLIGEGSNSPEATGSHVKQDFIARPGADPIAFSSADTLVGLKKDGGIGKALVENNTTKASNVGVTFSQPLRIEGNINLTSGNSSASINLDDPFLIRELSKIIQEELSRSLGGGRISSNPI